MEEIKAPKKERKFLKAVGNIAKVLANELVMGIARKFIGKAIDKVGNKRQGLIIAFVMVAGVSYAAIDSIPYPITGNKQRLGWQTSGNGLVWRGTAADTVTKPTSYADKNVKAYLILDSVSGSLYVFKQGAWAAISGGGGFTQPIDSLFFDTSVPSNNVDTAKMRWDSELGTVVLGMYDQVPNELGFKNFWLVKNQTGSNITKGSIVYANGTVGASGRITVAKFIANGSIESKYVLGITAHDLTDGEDGYVISYGKIRQVNTDTFAAGTILYPSPTTAGVWTDVEPVAPNIDMPIGFCINSSSNNGTIAIKVESGFKLHELHDVAITSPVDKASLYYSGGLWRDTTAVLLVSDTASMLSNYATKAYADTTGRFYARQEFRSVSSSTLTWTQTDTLVVNDTTSLQVYRNGQILLPNQYTVPTSTSVEIATSSFKIGDNYTVILPRGGGAGSGGGSGSLTSITAGTGIVVSPNPITTTGTVSADLTVMMELTDTTLLNLTTRFATKQNNITLTTTGTSGASTLVGSTLNIPQYTGGSGTVTSVGSGYGILGGPITTTGTLTVDTSTVYDFVRDSIVAVEIGGDTIKIIKQEYIDVTNDTLVFTILPKFPIQLRQFILLFRNGQLLLNDQFSIIDTNKVKVAASSFKLGENYTLVTVSGIGSVSSGQGNPVYPEAGIALSTGTTWTTSITNNSSNWNTAFTDRLKWDGGSTGLVAATGRTSLGGTTIGQSMFTLTNPSAITFPRFNADNTVDARSAANFRSDIGAGTVTSVTASGTAGNPLSITNTTTTPAIELLSATTARNGYLTSTDWTTFNNKFAFSDTSTLNLTSRFASKLNTADTASLSSRIDGKVSLTATESISGIKTFNNLVNIGNQMTISGSVSGANILLGKNTTNNGVADITLGTGLSITSNVLNVTAGSGTVTNVSGTGAISVINPTTTPVISVATAAFGTAGIVSSSGTQQFSGDKVFEGYSQFNGIAFFKNYNYTATRLAGLSSTDRFATVTLSTPITLSSGTLNIADASASASGLVNTTTQTFAGNKTYTGNVDISTGTLNVGSTGTFGGRVKTPWLERTYTSTTATTLTVSVNTTWLNIHQDAAVTLTLPSAATYPGKELIIKQTGAGLVSSASSNIIEFATSFLGSPQSVIVNPTLYRFTTLVSDGTYWIKMQRN